MQVQVLWQCFSLFKFLVCPSHSIFAVYRGNNSSVIRQKGESQNRCVKKTKHAKFSEKRTISYPLIRTCIHFSENLVCFVFLRHPFWDSPFCLITDELPKSYSVHFEMVYLPVSSQYSISMPPKNISGPEVFRSFQGV